MRAPARRARPACSSSSSRPGWRRSSSTAPSTASAGPPMRSRRARTGAIGSPTRPRGRRSSICARTRAPLPRWPPNSPPTIATISSGTSAARPRRSISISPISSAPAAPRGSSPRRMPIPSAAAAGGAGGGARQPRDLLQSGRLGPHLRRGPRPFRGQARRQTRAPARSPPRRPRRTGRCGSPRSTAPASRPPAPGPRYARLAYLMLAELGG